MDELLILLTVVARDCLEGIFYSDFADLDVPAFYFRGLLRLYIVPGQRSAFFLPALRATKVIRAISTHGGPGYLDWWP